MEASGPLLHMGYRNNARRACFKCGAEVTVEKHPIWLSVRPVREAERATRPKVPGRPLRQTLISATRSTDTWESLTFP